MPIRPTPEQVLLLAPDRSAAAAAAPLATPGVWSAAGCDDGAVWGHYIATSAEPYEVAVDYSDDIAGPAYRCTCPSRKVPCKHALGLLLLHAGDGVARARRLPFVAEWLRRRSRRVAPPPASDDASDETRDQPTADAVEEATSPRGDGDHDGDAGVGLGGGARAPQPGLGDGASIDDAASKRRIERAERMRAGLRELDRWLADRIRVGLAAAELSDPTTWDRLAARLVDAQCGGLANRVKRVAARVGQHSRWHEDVLEEMAMLHALAVGAQRSSALEEHLADGVLAAAGLTVAKDDVLAGVPSTAAWAVVGESRTREDRITVQRTWLVTAGSGGEPTWAMILAFGAFGNEVVTEHAVGSVVHADVHWYPGSIPLRALLGRQHAEPVAASTAPPCQSIAGALAAAGWAMAAEPWVERYPLSISATPASVGGGRWVVADASGSIPLAPGFTRVAELVCMSEGRSVGMVGEWTSDGFTPLTLFADRRVIAL